jgi:hypothetical protein
VVGDGLLAGCALGGLDVGVCHCLCVLEARCGSEVAAGVYAWWDLGLQCESSVEGR